MIEIAETKDGKIETADDAVNHPSHYNIGNIEAIDVIEDWNLDFSLGSAVKYICRAGHKDGNTKLQDLQKASWYIRKHRGISTERLRGRVKSEAESD